MSIANAVKHVDLLDDVARIGATTIGIKAKWFLIAGAVLGWTAFVATTANKLTRDHFKAGQVEALEIRNQALVDGMGIKDDLLQQAMTVQSFSKEQMGQVLSAFVEVSVRQPTNTEKIRTEIRDAPTKYAEFDPKQCLSYLFPDGMQLDQQREIEQYFATLPQFDAAGRRIVSTPAPGDSAP